MWTKSFNSEKELNIFIKNVEKLVRSSLEYKNWLQLVRSQGGWKCFLTDITLEQATIEIHHTPYTLYDLVEIMICNQREKFDTFSISQKIMLIHFNDLVGWIPLTKTIHERVHNEDIIIPLHLVKGNYKKFKDLYFIPKDIDKKINYKIKKMKEI